MLSTAVRLIHDDGDDDVDQKPRSTDDPELDEFNQVTLLDASPRRCRRLSNHSRYNRPDTETPENTGHVLSAISD